ncbi:hypothetical protein ACEWY4_000268 [Coilia grayii]|uniref:TNFR-Cys domain-containing protein n=1 Tax=Coilia grayii TaxID=363190 RepID=A0ABD1KW63_9TELE
MERFLSALIIVAVSLPGSCEICMGLSYSPTGYEECCPMCNPGYYVYRHCTEYSSTRCAPCPSSTYTDTHSGLEACRRCTACNSSAGLRVKRECSSTSDTLCEPLEGHYCTDPIQDGCRGAVEHTKCKPGQFIKQQGTASSDTVCGDCGNSTYSDGTFTSCRPHTQCQSGYETIKEGTPSSDTECHTSIIGLVLAVSAAVIIAVTVILTAYKKAGMMV